MMIELVKNGTCLMRAMSGPPIARGADVDEDALGGGARFELDGDVHPRTRSGRTE